MSIYSDYYNPYDDYEDFDMEVYCPECEVVAEQYVHIYSDGIVVFNCEHCGEEDVQGDLETIIPGYEDPRIAAAEYEMLYGHL